MMQRILAWRHLLSIEKDNLPCPIWQRTVARGRCLWALTNRKLLRLGNVMDNYDLSNLPLLGHCEDSGEHHPLLTDEENRRATFSGRSTTVTTSEQAERQQPPPTGDAQIPEQRALADFDISLASNVSTPLIVGEPVVDESEDPFAALAAYRSLAFDDDSQHPLTANWAWALAFSKASRLKTSLILLLKTLPILYWPNQKRMMFLSHWCYQSGLSNPSNLRANPKKVLSFQKVQIQALFQAGVHASGVRFNQEMWL